MANVETRPSGGALRPQVAVLAHNLAAAGNATPLREYDGYTVMPTTVSRRELMRLEVNLDGRPKPSTLFPDLTSRAVRRGSSTAPPSRSSTFAGSCVARSRKAGWPLASFRLQAAE